MVWVFARLVSVVYLFEGYYLCGGVLYGVLAGIGGLR